MSFGIGVFLRNTSAQQGPTGGNGPEIYKYYMPGISLEAANQFALAQWRRISAAQYVATMVVPLTRTKFSEFAITSLVRLHGLPTQQPNQNYYPRRLTWELDIETGGKITIEAQNVELPSGQV